MPAAGAAIPPLRVESPAPIRSMGAGFAWGTALAAVVLAGLLAAAWPTVQRAGIETGDFAANTLLILDAKSFDLLAGNYSRIGFNHPGPALLYVLAAGEAVFHDWLRLVPSPFAGQLVAVSFYSTFWIVLVFRVLCRGFDAPAAAFATSLYALTLAGLDHAILGGIWFPHLYVMPFGAFVAAASRLVHGRTDSLVTLALASGVLINGHASFIVVIAVVGLTIVVANALVERDRLGGTRILSRSFFAAHRGRLLVAAGVLALFLLPLAIRTMREFPGPLFEYATFGRYRKPNGFLASLRFIWFYWGGPIPFLLGAAVALPAIVVLGRRCDLGRFGRAVNGLLVAFVAAFLAVLVYARHGVDVMEYRYIGCFYHAVPALAVGLAGACGLALLPSGWRPAAALAGAAACLAAVYPLVARPPDYVGEFDAPRVAEIHDAMKPLAAGGRIVVDLDGTEGWGYVWSNMVGARAYGKRQGDDLFCIDRNWHILFTKVARCSPAELSGRPRFVVRRAEPPAAGIGGTGVIAVQGLTFTPVAP